MGGTERRKRERTKEKQGAAAVWNGKGVKRSFDDGKGLLDHACHAR